MHKNKIIIITLLLLFATFFSWYEIWPSYVRHKCLVDARENAVLDTNQPQYYKDDLIERTKLQDQLIEQGYMNCIREYGLAL
jgi:hypothetical protein